MNKDRGVEIVKNKQSLNMEKGQGELSDFGFKKVPTEEKARLVSGHFSSIAEKYDFSNTVLSFGMHHLWKATAVRMMGLSGGERVLDLCGGTGDLSILAARQIGAEGRVILCDINWEMVETGKPKIARSGFTEQIRYVQGDAENLSFPDCSFDAAMVGFGIRNVTNIRRGLEEMHRVTKPGGVLMCLEFSRPMTPWFRFLYDFYSFTMMPFLGKVLTGSSQAYSYLPESIRLFPLQEELKKTLEDIGYEQVHYRNLTNGIAVVHWGKKRFI
ncbi:MAG: Ubiquinone/menaquinone biosynthesis C-methyltransferase UbiE [Syntrophus sp. SKADARSKE-3]|nr:Ubiquinone/menaquinone biosynthesis C-methyltransferase UbiE [Syntrophus sp. SKADARSKE-3]